MLPGSFSRPWRSRWGLVGTELQEPDHPGASCWSSACKDNIGTPVLQCHFDLVTVHGSIVPESFDYPRPEPFFAPFAVPTVDRAIRPKLLLWAGLATKSRCPCSTVSRKAPVGHGVLDALGLAPM
jgi:hypothetical protein